MRVLLLICMPVLLLAQGQYQEQFPFLESPESENSESLPGTYQQQVQLEPVVRPEKSGSDVETEPTEPGPLDCREEQYPCTRLYSVHKPCKQCLNSLCFYSLRRVYVINKEVCVRTVCAHEELLRGGFPLLGLQAFMPPGLFLSHLTSLFASSGSVSRPVLPLWRGGAERSVLITRRKLREELRWLLMIRDPTCPDTAAPPPPPPRPLHFLLLLLLTLLLLTLPPVLLCQTALAYSFVLFSHMHVCTLDPVCADKYTPKNIDDCINHWCYKNV
uniref:Microfibril associated protein 2 n=1 Tax=Stegastes partitus TaxID=144197 RepID=A0A3B5A8D1_9TELE